MGRGAGGNLIVRLGFHRVDEVGELDRVLDEEHRHVVADQVEVAFVGVELHREAAHVAHRIGGAARPLHGGEAHEHRGALAGLGEEARLGQVAEVIVGLEVAMGGGATGVDHALGDALVVEVGDLLPHDEVFEQRRAALAGLQGVLVVGDAGAGVGAQRLAGGVLAIGLQLLQLGVAVATIDGVGAGRLAALRIVLLAHRFPLLILGMKMGRTLPCAAPFTSLLDDHCPPWLRWPPLRPASEARCGSFLKLPPLAWPPFLPASDARFGSSAKLPLPP